jgi:beta-mannosidase
MSSLAETSLAAPAPAQILVEGHQLRVLSEGWQASATPAELSCETAEGAACWPARVPGTAAGALRDAGAWREDLPRDFDAEDWWFRTSFHAEPLADGEQVVLCLDGIATVAEVYLNGERVLDSESMFAAHALDVGSLLRSCNELTICCRGLGPRLAARRRPRARWRTRLVAQGNLRFFRTMLLGRAPGFAGGPPAIGPWREVRLERRRQVVVEQLSLRPSVERTEGRLLVHARLRALDDQAPATVEVELSRGAQTFRAPLALVVEEGGGALVFRGELAVPDVALWWPHTHGEPATYDARLIVSRAGSKLTVTAARVGFRSIAFGAGHDHDVLEQGLDLHVNGERVFARGCVWTPLDLVGMAPAPDVLRAALEQVRDAGMNLLRIPGTSAYESTAFHDLCDELGVLVWQDFMFANLDYPIADPAFREAVEREAREVLGRLAGRPSLAVLCGNSEVEQQVAMLGLEPSLGRGELFGELLPELLRESGVDAAYVPSAPCGGDLPFRTDRGISNYYGVGGYMRPLDDVRRARVRFAAECLAFANVPDEAAVEEMLPDAPGQLVVHHPRWKLGVPRDSGSGWDFEDVRDHYLQLLFGVDPVQLRRVDHERYLELSRAVTGEVMAEVFGEWRRAASPCGGGLVLWLRDLAAGAGWGVIDHRGEPKAAYHHLRRALAPVAVWTTDEGLNGVLAHVANDRPDTLTARLRVSLYRDFELHVHEAQQTLELPGHGHAAHDVEQLLGRFVDASWAYRFGPPAHDLLVASLERPGDRGAELISQSVRFPAGRPTTAESADRLGLSATACRSADGTLSLRVRSRRFAYGVRVHAPGFTPADDAFSVEPGGERIVALRARAGASAYAGGALTALNLDGRVRIQTPEEGA